MRPVRTVHVPSLDLELRTPRAHPGASALARLRGPWLDSQFAAGGRPWTSRTHAARSIQLTNVHRRRTLARSLERLLVLAAQPPAPLGGPVPICRPQVHEARAEILATAARLRSSSPVDVRGMAMLQEMLGDGRGPVYTTGRPGALMLALRNVLDSLDVVD